MYDMVASRLSGIKRIIRATAYSSSGLRAAWVNEARTPRILSPLGDCMDRCDEEFCPATSKNILHLRRRNCNAPELHHNSDGAGGLDQGRSDCR